MNATLEDVTNGKRPEPTVEQKAAEEADGLGADHAKRRRAREDSRPPISGDDRMRALACTAGRDLG